MLLLDCYKCFHAHSYLLLDFIVYTMLKVGGERTATLQANILFAHFHTRKRNIVILQFSRTQFLDPYKIAQSQSELWCTLCNNLIPTAYDRL